MPISRRSAFISSVRLPSFPRTTSGGSDAGGTPASVSPACRARKSVSSGARPARGITWREREIIRLRYGLQDGYTYTLEEVGRIFRVTRERVRQIEAKAVRKLQHPIRSQHLEGFLKQMAG